MPCWPATWGGWLDRAFSSRGGPPPSAAAPLGVALWLETALHRQTALTDYPGRPSAGPGSTWLLVGSDSRQSLTTEQEEALATGGDTRHGRNDHTLLVHT